MLNITNKRKAWLQNFMQTNNHLITLFTLAIIAAILSKGIFIRVSNLSSVILRASILGMIALGQTLVILTSGIDLSVASNLGLCVAVMSYSLRMGITPLGAMGLGICISTLTGLINGLWCAFTKMPPFIVTLSTMMIIKSISLAAIGTHATTFYEVQEIFNRIMSWIPFLGAASFPAIVWIITTIICFFVIRNTRFGYNLYATGGHEKAALYSGVNTKFIKVSVYSLSGFFVGVATILYVYRLGGTNPVAGGQYQLESIAASVIGGTSLAGGEGKILGTFIGTIVMTMLVNFMNIMNVNPFLQKVVIGVIFIIFVFLLDFVRNLKIKNSD